MVTRLWVVWFGGLPVGAGCTSGADRRGDAGHVHSGMVVQVVWMVAVVGR